MKCTNCGTENNSKAKFCIECGKKLVQISSCPNCGAKINPNVKFCSNCGFNLSSKTNNVVQNNSVTEEEVNRIVILPSSEFPISGCEEVYFLYNEPKNLNSGSEVWQTVNINDAFDPDKIAKGKNLSLLKVYANLLKENGEEKIHLYICSSAQIYANENSRSLFGNFGRDLKKIVFENFDTSKVIDISSMFENCEKLKSLDLSNFNMENVDNFWYMFKGCESLSNIKFPNLDEKTSKYLYLVLQNFVEVLDNSYKAVEKMLSEREDLDEDYLNMVVSMFEDCENLEKIDLPEF